MRVSYHLFCDVFTSGKLWKPKVLLFSSMSQETIQNAPPLAWMSCLQIFTIANMLENVKIWAILAIISNFGMKKVGKCQS